jgi:hypothetical protein
MAGADSAQKFSAERQPTGASWRRETSSKIRKRWRDAARHLWFGRRQQTDARPQGRQQVVHSPYHALALWDTATERLCGLLSGEINSDEDRTNWSFV